MTYILLEGLPGVGKTTLIKKIANKLKHQHLEVEGFYTEEVRKNNHRIGFDIVTLDNKRAPLARKSFTNPKETELTLGQYVINIEEFEKLALPVFDITKNVLIIDEIGKMELFSQQFTEKVKAVIAKKAVKLIATVPLRGGPPLIKDLKTSSNCILFSVTKGNRDILFNEIMKYM